MMKDRRCHFSVKCSGSATCKIDRDFFRWDKQPDCFLMSKKEDADEFEEDPAQALLFGDRE